MISTNRILLISISAIFFVTVNIAIIFGIGSLVSYLNSGADRSQMLHANIARMVEYTPSVSWDLSNQSGKRIDNQSLGNIERDYLNAWYTRHLSLLSNSVDIFGDYYTDKAKSDLIALIENNRETGVKIEATTTSHDLKFDFLSTDGHLAVFTDRRVKEFQRVFKNEDLISQSHYIGTYRIIMLLEDGFWRIRHMMLIEDSEEPAVTHAIDSSELIENIKGINYYPQASPWDTFGHAFDTEIISADFDIIKNAGLNTIRVFIQYEDFGKAEINDIKMERLQRLLDKATEKNLKVILTLFDFYGDYSVLDWTRTLKHAEGIVEALKDHPAILAWDIKNEPDLDFESRGKDNVINWLKIIIKKINDLDPSKPITIGWANYKHANNLSDVLDFISFHYYGDIEKLPEIYSDMKQEHPNKAVLLEEYGLSSYQGFWRPFGDDESDQADYHKSMQTIFKKNAIPFMSWTLYDFNKIPKEVVGRLPWRKRIQQRFGFIDLNGSPKKSFEYIATNQ
ncbi:MAG: cellulase family glycosylhydrolase [Flavobacteriaceae bacterium]|nr:cellulase family glycosylhydrolase [Flavobacteriaceae bacterium]